MGRFEAVAAVPLRPCRRAGRLFSDAAVYSARGGRGHGHALVTSSQPRFPLGRLFGPEACMQGAGRELQWFFSPSVSGD